MLEWEKIFKVFLDMIYQNGYTITLIINQFENYTNP